MVVLAIHMGEIYYVLEVMIEISAKSSFDGEFNMVLFSGGPRSSVRGGTLSSDQFKGNTMPKFLIGCSIFREICILIKKSKIEGTHMRTLAPLDLSLILLCRACFKEYFKEK